MRRRARTDLCGGRSVMIVPTATVITVVSSNYTNDREFPVQLGSENKMRQRRILSSTAGSDLLGKFSTLLYFSTGYQTCLLHRYDPICRVLNMELLRFYYSVRATRKLASRAMVRASNRSSLRRLSLIKRTFRAWATITSCPTRSTTGSHRANASPFPRRSGGAVSCPRLPSLPSAL